MYISYEVKKAILNRQPVVCLETTIISHGMPYPQNVETALAVEQIIRSKGAIPATIGIVDGEPVIGMTRAQIEEFGQRKDIVKASRSDLPVIFAKGLWASTTVSATMILAARAGIEIFVTGGIGGVHRDYTETMDLSTDLEELSQTDVTVICSGAKSILDIPKTLEYLETKGVTVFGFGTNDFPSFYCRESGYKTPYSIDSAREASKIIHLKRVNDIKGGILIVNPVPEEAGLTHSEIDPIIEKAIEESRKLGIAGKIVTPFLLKRIAELSNNRSLEANIALIQSNAAVGADIAICLHKRFE